MFASAHARQVLRLEKKPRVTCECLSECFGQLHAAASAGRLRVFIRCCIRERQGEASGPCRCCDPCHGVPAIRTSAPASHVAVTCDPNFQVCVVGATFALASSPSVSVSSASTFSAPRRLLSLGMDSFSATAVSSSLPATSPPATSSSSTSPPSTSLPYTSVPSSSFSPPTTTANPNATASADSGSYCDDIGAPHAYCIACSCSSPGDNTSLFRQMCPTGRPRADGTSSSACSSGGLAA